MYTPSMTMTKETVLITGATGFIGGRVLQLLLEQDYNIRIVVRSVSKEKSLRANPNLKGVEKADFVVVPDLLAPSALDKAAANADYIVHLASPIPVHGNVPPEDQRDTFIMPAVNATLRALEAAQQSGTVKRVVITSSAVAVIPPAILLPSEDPPSDHVASGDNRLAELEPPFAHNFVAYIASKVAALNASDKFMKEQTPAFDIVNIMPSYVIGRNVHANTVEQLFEGTNAVFLALLTGKSDPNTPPELGQAVHVDDVALLHVLALDQAKINKFKGIENFYASENIIWDDITKIAAQKFPNAVTSGRLPATGTKKSKPGISDSSKAEKVLGRKLKTIEDMVTDLTNQYLEVLGRS